MIETTITIYRCEICGRKSENKEDIIKCEKEHIDFTTIHKFEFSLYGHFPTAIYLKNEKMKAFIRYKYDTILNSHECEEEENNEVNS